MANLQIDTPIDVTITGAGAAIWVGSELLKGSLGPTACRWCGTRADGSENVNPVDRGIRNSLRWSNTGLADGLSYATAFALAPVLAFGGTALAAHHDGALKGFWTDALVISEATVLALDFNQLVKFAIARERPFVHALSPGDKAKTAQPSDNNVSFFSGHTTLAFVLAASSGTVASMRGYRYAPVIWASGMSLAAFSGYLRIAADKHYFSDVMAGALVGTAFGIGIPLIFHHARGPGQLSAQPNTTGAAFSYAGTW